MSIRIVHWLQQNAHDAIHLRDQGLQRLPDPDIFDKADVERRIILTFDLDFGEIAAFSRGRIVSIVLFRLHNTRTPHVIERLQSALNFADALEKGAVVVVEESRVSSDHVATVALYLSKLQLDACRQTGT